MEWLKIEPHLNIKCHRYFNAMPHIDDEEKIKSTFDWCKIVFKIQTFHTHKRYQGVFP